MKLKSVKDQWGDQKFRRLAGALQGKKTNKRVFITTGSFLDETRRYMEMIDSKIVLIDGKQRADQILDNNIGISTENRNDMKEPNSDYFVELQQRRKFCSRPQFVSINQGYVTSAVRISIASQELSHERLQQLSSNSSYFEQRRVSFMNSIRQSGKCIRFHKCTYANVSTSGENYLVKNETK